MTTVYNEPGTISWKCSENLKDCKDHYGQSKIIFYLDI
jgi:hypothetical protein